MQFFARGDRGNEVVDIQVRLSTLGYNLGPNGVDGCFGKFTEEAVKKFQRDRNLAVTGIVNRETWKALVEATYKLGDRLLYLRLPFFRGDDVKELQLSLNALGFNTGKVDGIYGETTERAVREFQRNSGLASDGIFGPSTLAAMRNLQHLLTDKVSRVFPDPHRDQQSAISIFKNRKIAVDLDMQVETRGSGALAQEMEVSRDLGMRLGNLLELLGADVFYLGKINSRNNSRNRRVLNGLGDSVELYIGFRLSSDPNTNLCGSRVFYQRLYNEVERDSQALARAIQKEIIRSLGSQDLGIKPCDFKLKIKSIIPATLVMPLFITNPKEKALLDQEIFRQKIAVAAFDGIKNYLQAL
ncbi:MAG: peptidoglycan-binding protein [Actinomycetota bacterium]|nr:peptidoglycan-binding protein [Actinomycetota bacterium]